MTNKLRFRRGYAPATALIVVSLLLGACSGRPAAGSAPNGLGSGQDKGSAATAPAPTPAVLEVFPANLATGVLPSARVTVKATSGSVVSVTLADGTGKRVKGHTGSGGTWRATAELLHPSTTYAITVSATGPDGTATKTKSRFTTLRPAVRATYGLVPNGGTVGVGMPVSVQFSSAVTTQARRAEVEKRVKITTVPAQPGAWGWLDNRQLMWRPREYWVPGTRVTVSTPLHGVQTGDNKWVMGDDGTSFTVGSAMVSSVDMKAHTLTVRRGGAVIRSFKVSTGKPGPLTETRSGTKVISERSSAIVMDSATVGIPKGNKNYYKIKTKWNLRLTWTGEFIHSAPWSVNSQGTQNVSHGCTNMAPADAQWMFNNSKVGDIVKFTGSSRAFTPAEGIGVWVYDFAGWQAQSART